MPFDNRPIPKTNLQQAIHLLREVPDSLYDQSIVYGQKNGGCGCAAYHLAAPFSVNLENPYALHRLASILIEDDAALQFKLVSLFYSGNIEGHSIGREARLRMIAKLEALL